MTGSEQYDHGEQEVNVMAKTIPVEEESGTFTGHVHAHNGYYAGTPSDYDG